MGGFIQMPFDIAAGAQEAVATAEESRAKQQALFTNRLLAERASGDALQRGAIEAGKARIAGSRLEAKQRVAYTASGVDASVGTPANVIADTAALGELDAQTVENNAAREAWGYRQKGAEFASEIEAEKRRQANRQTAQGIGFVAKGTSNAASGVKDILSISGGG
jgi:hypothetical protein